MFDFFSHDVWAEKKNKTLGHIGLCLMGPKMYALSMKGWISVWKT